MLPVIDENVETQYICRGQSKANTEWTSRSLIPSIIPAGMSFC